MFPDISSIAASASSYFYLPIEDDEDQDEYLDTRQKHIAWESSSPLDYHDTDTNSASSSSSSSSTSSPILDPPHKPTRHTRTRSVIKEVLAHDDLYKILGISRTSQIDRLSLRRAYLTRSKACHPDKFPGNPEATQAFQKVAVAYDVLSKPGSKRMYDTHPTSFYDFSAHPYQHAEETFRGVVLGVFNDFLDGDLGTVRTLLRAVNDLNPSLRLGDEGIDSVLLTLESIRQRALTCRTCVLALNAELSRLLEVQYAFRQLSYFDIRRRSRLSIELARIAICLPLALDRALQRQKQDTFHDRSGTRDGIGGPPTPSTALLNRRVYRLLCAFSIVLERMESFF